MLNNFIYYYVLFIIALISINLLIRLSKYIYIYIRNRYLYKGYYYKVNDTLYNSFKYYFFFTPRVYETIFKNYYNMLKILLCCAHAARARRARVLFLIIIAGGCPPMLKQGRKAAPGFILDFLSLILKLNNIFHYQKAVYCI
jgi:hypothetical protein